MNDEEQRQVLETLMVYLAEELTSKPNKPVLSYAAQQELVTLQ